MDRAQLKSRLEPLLKGRRDVLLWVAKYGGVLTVFLAFFVPLFGNFSAVSSRVSSLQIEVEDMKRVGPGLMTFEEADAIRARAAAFESKLMPASRSVEFLHEISAEAEKHGFELIEINSDAPVPVKDAQGREIEFSGAKLSLFPVNFRVQTDTKNFAYFLSDLSARSAGMFVVENLELQKSSQESQDLQCDITLSYVVR